ncbi:MAG: DUF4215 domain-containing protein [Myxococcales bacterium]|nr:DUF4215 domain-containing protein [Myxococcales bacterium]
MSWPALSATARTSPVGCSSSAGKPRALASEANARSASVNASTSLAKPAKRWIRTSCVFALTTSTVDRLREPLRAELRSPHAAVKRRLAAFLSLASAPRTREARSSLSTGAQLLLSCTNACHHAVCGDGVLHEGVEECDDCDLVNDDGCNAACLRDRKVFVTKESTEAGDH